LSSSFPSLLLFSSSNFFLFLNNLFSMVKDPGVQNQSKFPPKIFFRIVLKTPNQAFSCPHAYVFTLLSQFTNWIGLTNLVWSFPNIHGNLVGQDKLIHQWLDRLTRNLFLID
jgi:hypothetical protein